MSVVLSGSGCVLAYILKFDTSGIKYYLAYSLSTTPVFTYQKSTSPFSFSFLILESIVLFQFLSQRKKQEAEERRIKLKKAREEFKQMLEVCCLLLLEISSTIFK